MMQADVNLVMGKIEFGAETIEMTRQEAAIVTILKHGPQTMAGMVAIIFDEQKDSNGKTLGVHMCSIRKKIAGKAAIKWDAALGHYEMVVL